MCRTETHVPRLVPAEHGGERHRDRRRQGGCHQRPPQKCTSTIKLCVQEPKRSLDRRIALSIIRVRAVYHYIRTCAGAKRFHGLANGRDRRGRKTLERNMWKRTPSTVGLAAILASTVALAVACQPQDENPTPPGSDLTAGEPTPTVAPVDIEPASDPEGAGSTPEPTPPPAFVWRDFRLAEDGGHFERLLRFVPDTPSTGRSVSADDVGPWWAAFAGLGFERPGPDAPPGWEGDFWRQAIERAGTSMGYPFLPALRPRLVEPWFCFFCLDDRAPTYPTVGFDMRSVDLALGAGGGLEVVVGDYDPARTQNRLESCDECAPYTSREHNGVRYYRWGDDFGGRLVVGDGFALRAIDDAGIEDVIDTMKGDSPALADDQDIAVAARALRGLHAYSATFSRSGNCVTSSRSAAGRCFGYPGDDINDPLLFAIRAQPFLEPFSLVAAGFADTDPALPADVVVVLVHESDEAAQANAVRLPLRLALWEEEQREESDQRAEPPEGGYWNERVERLEVGVEGRVVMARIVPKVGPGGVPRWIAPQWILRSSTIVLVHG